MAKKKGRKRKYTKARKTYARARSGGGKFKNILDGVMGGAGDGFLSGFIGEWSTPVAFGAVGYFRNNPTLQTLAGVSVGEKLVTMLPFIGGGGTGNGGGGGY